MTTKDQMSGELNDMLNLDIDWSELKKEDLDNFHEMVEQGVLLEPLAKAVAKKHGKSKLDEQIDNWRPGDIVTRLL